MAYDQLAAGRIRELLADTAAVTEKPIVGGGIGFMVGGHLCCGLSARGLTVRAGPSGMAAALERAHVRPLEFGGRATAAFVVVEPEGYETDEQLREWVMRGLEFVGTLPPR